LIGPIIHIGLNHFKYGSEQKTFYGICMFVNYYIVFAAQGILYQTWKKEQDESFTSLKKTMLYPALIASFILLYGIA
jgi:hypothetical protein